MEPPLCVVSSWLKKRVYTILISITISGSSNLDNCFYHINITSQKFYSTPFHLLFIILYSSPPCGSTPVLPSYLLLQHSCTWDKTSIFWSCHQACLEATFRQIFSLVTLWVHSVLLISRSFGHVRLPIVSSWSWRKIL